MPNINKWLAVDDVRQQHPIDTWAQRYRRAGRPEAKKLRAIRQQIKSLEDFK